MKDSSMKGQTVIVTGGAKGYGAGIAEVLKEAGAEVWITGRDKVALHAAAKRLDVHAVAADVTSPQDWDRLFKAVLAATGRLDVLVNNAGAGIKVAPMAEQTDEAIAQSIAVNLTGPLYGCRRAAPVMVKQKAGIIINISSVCATYAWPGFGPYSAAKGGLNQFGHCLYAELRAAGVRVTTLTPSWGATEFLTAANIQGHPASDPEIRRQCMQPRDMGQMVLDICTAPPHLAIPDVTVLPLVQQIEPM